MNASLLLAFRTARDEFHIARRALKEACSDKGGEKRAAMLKALRRYNVALADLTRSQSAVRNSGEGK